MSSLSAHLLEPGDHGRLPFHPSCPVCRRERLSGTLSAEPVVSRRAQAALVSGVLAFSGATPGVAAAAVPDSQAEGLAAPETPPGGELDDPAFDPGGETSLPFETAPVVSEPVEDDGVGAPIDIEPIDDPDARLAPPPADGGIQTEEVASPPAETPSPPAEVPPAAEDVPVPDSQPTLPSRETERPGPVNRHANDRHAPERHAAGGEEPGSGTPAAAPAPPPVPAPPPAVDPAVTPPPTETAPTSQTAASEGGRHGRLRDTHRYVVQPGDSLWSIAKRLLGADASAGRVAREVDRLWSLNAGRIATGDPDLLHVGTTLMLR